MVSNAFLRCGGHFINSLDAREATSGDIQNQALTRPFNGQLSLAFTRRQVQRMKPSLICDFLSAISDDHVTRLQANALALPLRLHLLNCYACKYRRAIDVEEVTLRFATELIVRVLDPGIPFRTPHWNVIRVEVVPS